MCVPVDVIIIHMSKIQSILIEVRFLTLVQFSLRGFHDIAR